MAWQGVQEAHVNAGLHVVVNMSLIRELREQTGYGVEYCKQALKECNGNVESAREYMRFGREKWLANLIKGL
jgi:translation elongation factor EF-Ts